MGRKTRASSKRRRCALIWRSYGSEPCKTTSILALLANTKQDVDLFHPAAVATDDIEEDLAARG